ncbi:unnamed protein product [Prunus brigantina]
MKTHLFLAAASIPVAFTVIHEPSTSILGLLEASQQPSTNISCSHTPSSHAKPSSILIHQSKLSCQACATSMHHLQIFIKLPETSAQNTQSLEEEQSTPLGLASPLGYFGPSSR